MTTRHGISEFGRAGATLIAATLVVENAAAQGSKLLVFLHVAVKQRALQVALQSALPGITVTAVGRIGDFERELKDGTDAVLAIPLVLGAFKLNPKLQGMHSGSNDEKYALVGVGAEPDPKTVASVGALDLLGRDGTNGFVKDLLGASPHVERVSKVEDLLPLLQMQRVDAVLLPARLFSEIKSASKLTLAHKELSKPIGLPAVATTTAGGDAIVAAVARMAAAASKTLGVDSWR